MPFYPDIVAQALEAERETIERYLEDDRDAVRGYATALLEAKGGQSAAAIRAALGVDGYPGALPTEEFDSADDVVVPFEESEGWTCHEAVNDWAASVTETVTTVAADGSNLGPVREFNVPLGLTQVASFVNHHHVEGDFTRDIDMRLLGPTALTYETSEGMVYVDSQEPSRARYEHEAAVVIEHIEQFADCDRPPVIFYDGPLVVSFADAFEANVRTRYLTAMSRILAASQHHRVPVVGYLSGSNASEVAKMLRRLDPETLGENRLVPDGRLFGRLMEYWGERSIVFESRRDGTLDALKATYEGVEYAFGHEILFTYLNMPGVAASGVDRIEFPRWIVEAGLLEYTVDVVRAEAAIGRGYPEILQQADADAVLDKNDRQAFLRLVQKFADEHDLPINWHAKTLSKARRRRS